jgi:hypothetical protein
VISSLPIWPGTSVSPGVELPQVHLQLVVVDAGRDAPHSAPTRTDS